MSDGSRKPVETARSGYFEGERLELLWRYAYRPEFVPLLMDYLGVLPQSNVLEVGCGTGFLSRLIAKSVDGVQATGLDTDRASLELGRELVAAEDLEAQVKLISGSAFELPFPDEHFDTVTSQTLL